MAKRYTGYTAQTKQNRMTGAGAYYLNYDPTTDTPSTATAKLIGATKGGGSFMAKANIRTIEIDGIPGRVMGMEEIDSWDAEMTANVIEVTAETIALALGAAKTTTPVSPANYTKIEGKNTIDPTDYEDNVPFIGTVSGFDTPVIIQIFNALSTDGLSINPKDKDDAVIPMRWTGHYDEDSLDNPPFAIWVPKTV